MNERFYTSGSQPEVRAVVLQSELSAVSSGILFSKNQKSFYSLKLKRKS